MTARLFFIVGALVVAGCAAAYVPPPSTAQTATITYVRPAAENEAAGYGSGLFKVDGPQCAGRQIMTSASAGAKEPSEPLPIPAGQRAYFMLRLIGGYPLTMCYNVMSFEPEIGHAYRVTLELSGRRCDTRLLGPDGAPPPSFEQHPIAPKCRF